MARSKGDFEELAFKLSTVFKPTTPINREDLFAGRQSQTRDVVDAIDQVGQHAVLFGERGVGKTSLTNMIAFKLRSSAEVLLTVSINCNSQDTFDSIWKRVFREIAFRAEGRLELEEGTSETLTKLIEGYDPIDPDTVRRAFEQIGRQAVLVVFIDEFDTVMNPEACDTMSDTIKYLSDRGTPGTVVLVGVADSVTDLVACHQSVERCLMQIALPRMSRDEIEEILTKGLKALEMKIADGASHEVSRLASGLPHYAQLPGLHAGRAAAEDVSETITNEHVSNAIKTAIDKVQGTILAEYSKATTSSRQDARSREVLLACAMADADDLGWFYARNVRPPAQERIVRRELRDRSLCEALTRVR